MKITKLDLQLIFEAAKDYYLDHGQGDLDSQQFTALCYLKACERILNVTADVEKRHIVEPVE